VIAGNDCEFSCGGALVNQEYAVMVFTWKEIDTDVELDKAK